MKTIKSFFVACVAAFSLTSCLSDGDNEQKMTYNLSSASNFSYVTDSQGGGNPILLAGANYSVEFNYTAATANIAINDLLLSPSGSKINLLLEAVPLRVTESKNAYEMTKSSYTSVVGNETHTISTFIMRQYLTPLTMTEATMLYECYFVVDDRYTVRFVQATNINAGSTSIREIETGASTTSTKPTYGYQMKLSSDGKLTATFMIADLTINGQTYSKIQVDGVPASVNLSGVKLSSEEPLKVSNISKEMKIENLVISALYSPVMSISFNVDGKYAVSAQLSGMPIQGNTVN